MTRNALAPIGDQFNSLVSWADRMFDDCFHWPGLYNRLMPEKKWFMEVGKTNAYTKDGEYVLEVTLPGVKDGEISLTSTKEGILHLNVTASEKNEDKGKNYEYQEYRTQSFSRTFALPADVDRTTEPVAELRDGILTIRCKITALPPPVKDEPKRIAIKKIE